MSRVKQVAIIQHHSSFPQLAYGCHSSWLGTGQLSSVCLLETAAQAKALLAQSNRKDQWRVPLLPFHLKAGTSHALQQLWAQSKHCFQTHLSGLMLAQLCPQEERWEGQRWQGFMWLLPFNHHDSHQSPGTQWSSPKHFCWDTVSSVPT